jgi:hypothetical protein
MFHFPLGFMVSDTERRRREREEEEEEEELRRKREDFRRFRRCSLTDARGSGRRCELDEGHEGFCECSEGSARGKLVVRQFSAARK